MSEEIQPTEEIIFTDIFEIPPQPRYNGYWYKIKTHTEEFNVTIIASNQTTARDAISQQFQNSTVSYLGASTKLIQAH
jgi:hypothetical protein